MSANGHSRSSIRDWLLSSLYLFLTVMVYLQYLRLSRKIDGIVAEREQIVAERDEARQRLDQVDAEVRALKSQLSTPPEVSPDRVRMQQTQIRLNALEQQFQRLNTALPNRRLVPEYNPATAPPPADATPPATDQTARIWEAATPGPRRQWGPEQVTGAPDTERDGDIPTAWAPREPDAGPEWLQVEFDQAVEVAEVRIRETYNPGAITKIVALANGREVSLWEGTAAGGQSPRDFSVSAPPGISAQSVVVYLDTARVPGWNEIDAVELVGRDGSRQWANSASASSTYAERGRGNVEALTLEPVP